MKISFDGTSYDPMLCDFIFPDPVNSTALIELRSKHETDHLIKGTTSDLQRAMIILNWTHGKWEHNPENRPTSSDALTILNEADQGAQFRCVEYGIVLSAALNSIGIPTRTLGLKTRDVETTKYGAGHVVSEAYLPDLNKWVFLDGQLNYIPFLGSKPLNAVEYQQAIVAQKDEIKLMNQQGQLTLKKTKSYVDWVGKYLYYFDTYFDHTEQSTMRCNGKKKLMLYPLNTRPPRIFQIKDSINNCLYTNNLKDFYRDPKF